MRQEQLNAIKERVAKATPGPWEYDEDELGIWNKGGFNYLGTVTLSHNSAEFIAHAREDVPALITEIERLQAQLNSTEKCFEIMQRASFELYDRLKRAESLLDKVELVEVKRRQEVEKLRDALEFYANKVNWKRHNTSEPYSLDGGYEAPTWEPSAIEFDEGEKACRALAGEVDE